MSNTKTKQSNMAKIVAMIVIFSILLVALLTASTVYFGAQTQSYKNQLENTYQRAFYDASASLEDISVKLDKMQIAGSQAQVTSLANSVWKQSSVASYSLSSLPTNQELVTSTNKFVTQLGEYVYSLASKLEKGAFLTDQEVEQIAKLQEQAKSLKSSLKNLGAQLGNDFLITDHADSDSTQRTKDFYKTFVEVDEMGVEYPSLIYDGPFSDNLKDSNGSAIDNLPTSTAEQAVQYIKDSFEGSTNVKYLYEMQDLKCKTHELTFNSKNGTPMYVQLSVKGLQPIMLSGTKQPTYTALSKTEATQKASDMASKLLDVELHGVWYQKVGNIAYVNLAPIVNDTIYYTDLVKAKIDLQDGEIIGLESHDFIINHKSKTLNPIQISQSQALQIVSPRLEVKSTRLAIIPTFNDKYVQAYEISGEYNQRQFFVYVDVTTGEEVQILEVMEDTGLLI